MIKMMDSASFPKCFKYHYVEEHIMKQSKNVEFNVHVYI